ncbi:ATP-binding cassette domain-containing protein, partial [Saccharomonospora iraqiensis]|uniref:ATP-binding cassette domain-containing protein n=1 Tax=Saccharomonospora iraqiensis TaxID=52698 RepID=UPI0005936D79
MTLHADLDLRRDAFTLSVAFEVADGEVLAVLGPNGSGKSTVLSCLAGLLRPDTASVALAGRTLDDTRTHVAPHRRGVGLLAQEPRLFPHLSVLDNVAFGPRSRGGSRPAARERARRELGEVDALPLAKRR